MKNANNQNIKQFISSLSDSEFLEYEAAINFEGISRKDAKKKNIPEEVRKEAKQLEKQVTVNAEIEGCTFSIERTLEWVGGLKAGPVFTFISRKPKGPLRGFLDSVEIMPRELEFIAPEFAAESKVALKRIVALNKKYPELF